MMKKDFYRLDRMDAHKPQYAILLGERSNGKSYAVKERAINETFENKQCTFALIRRYKEDIKAHLMDSYFNDIGLIDLIKKLSNNEFDSIIYYQSYFYVAKLQDGKYLKGWKCGAVLSLSEDERYKSSFVQPHIKTIIFEEFTTNKLYLSKEVERFMNLCSTILRLNNGTVYMIANTISRICPYFNEWNLKAIPTMKFGQLDEYIFKTLGGDEVKICVELCASPEHKKSGMFFGNIGKTIEGGQWRTEERPHIYGDLHDYDILYQLTLKHMDFKYNILLISHKIDGYPCVYVYPASIHEHDRIISAEYSTNIFQTPGLNKDNPAECLIYKLIHNNKMVFPNNLIAEDFYTLIKNMSPYPFNML